MKHIFASIAALVLLPNYVHACTQEPPAIPPSPPARLADETERAYKLRSEAFSKAYYAAAIARRLAEQEAQVLEYQIRLFDNSAQVAVGQVVNAKSVRLVARGIDWGQVTSIVARPRFWLKGGRKGGTVRLTNTLTSCGEQGPARGNAINGYVVLFLSAGRIHEDRLLGSISQFDVKDPRVAAALEARGIRTTLAPGQIRIFH